MKIVVISLVRSEDRRQLMESTLGRLGLAFEFFPAIDAKRGEHLRISKYNEAAALRDLHRPLSVGEVGCFASHYVLWQRCLEAREPMVIMEDDLVVHDGFVRALGIASELLAATPLVRLGLTHEALDNAPVVHLPHGFEVVPHAPGTYGTQCYVLSPGGAKALIENAAVWSLPVDIYLERHQIHGVQSHGLRPYFVAHADQNLYPSVIGQDRFSLWPHERDAKIRSLVQDFVAKRGRFLKT